MNKPMIPIAAIALTLVALTSAVGAATISVDPTHTYQTIDGFGGFGGIVPEYSTAAQYSDAWVNMVVNDLGISIHRYFLNPNDLEPTNDNADPSVTNLSAFNVGGMFSGQVALLSRLHAAGVQTFFFSILTPPYWMKQGPFYSGTDSCCGGTLRTDMYDEFAEFCSAYIRLTKQLAGIDLYALSIQNEPRFSESYSSCVYDAAQYKAALIKVGARLASDKLGTKLMLAEDVIPTFGTIEGGCWSDTASRPYVGQFGVHAYSDGVTPTPTSAQASQWTAVARKVAPTAKHVWMTETSGYPDSWSGACTVAQGIYAALVYGQANGWVYYRLGGAADALTNNGQPTWLYYGCKHFFRYVRPGAVRIDCASDDTTVSAVAFTNATDQTLTLVMINQSTQAKSLTLQGVPAATFQVYRSSSSEQCVSVGAGSNTHIDLPASSLVTLHGTGYLPPASVGAGAHPWTLPATRSDNARSVRVHTLDGRIVDLSTVRQSGHGSAAGVYLVAPPTGGSAIRMLVSGR